MARVDVYNSKMSGNKRHFENAVFGTGAAVSAAPAANDDACERVSGAEEKELKPVLLRERDVWSADEREREVLLTERDGDRHGDGNPSGAGPEPSGRAKATATG
jgi:hypothetical protein